MADPLRGWERIWQQCGWKPPGLPRVYGLCEALAEELGELPPRPYTRAQHLLLDLLLEIRDTERHEWAMGRAQAKAPPEDRDALP